jgi:hypothetical protein
MGMNLELARQRLPLPELMHRMGLGDHAKRNAKSPFREERNPSFGIFENNGRWRWKDHGTGEGGDEVDFIAKLNNQSNAQAIATYCDLAGVRQDNRQSQPVYKLNGKSDWSKYRNAANDAFIERLATMRGISANILRDARDLDILGASNGQPAFRCGHGAHVRCDDGRWRFEPKGTQVEPLTMGDPNSVKVFFFESQWDMLAIADKLGDEWKSVFWVASRGASNGKVIGAFAEGKKVYAFPQNDQPKNGKIPSEQWMQDATNACNKSILRVRTPEKYKDANDWVKSGECSKRLVIAAINDANDPAMVGVEIHSFNELFQFTPQDDNTVLLGDRWVCQGGQLLIVGQSGVGKSSLTVQASMMWALGLPFFGIKPRRPLKSLFIQAENDAGDMAEIVQGVMKHVVAVSRMDHREAINTLTENITFARVTSQTGKEFIDVVDKLLDKKGECDLVFGDPLLSYIGDDLSQQSVASTFLRGLCNPIAFRRKFAWVWSHHTGKPQSDSKGRSHWNANDYAYVGLGSSELTNWARAIAVLQTTPEEGTFRLLLAKRGRRAGVLDFNGQPTIQIGLKHADKGLNWVACDLPTAEDAEKKAGRSKSIPTALEPQIMAIYNMHEEGARGVYSKIKKDLNLSCCDQTIANFIAQAKKRREP